MLQGSDNREWTRVLRGQNLGDLLVCSVLRVAVAVVVLVLADRERKNQRSTFWQHELRKGAGDDVASAFVGILQVHHSRWYCFCYMFFSISIHNNPQSFRFFWSAIWNIAVSMLHSVVMEAGGGAVRNFIAARGKDYEAVLPKTLLLAFR